jgi:hypothetical protein
MHFDLLFIISFSFLLWFIQNVKNWVHQFTVYVFAKIWFQDINVLNLLCRNSTMTVVSFITYLYICSFIFSSKLWTCNSCVGVGVNLVVFLRRILHQDNATAVNNISKWRGTVSIFSLIGAFFSDSHWGRYLTCAIFQLIYVVVGSFYFNLIGAANLFWSISIIYQNPLHIRAAHGRCRIGLKLISSKVHLYETTMLMQFNSN